MKYLLYVNSMQSENHNDPGAPTRLVLVSADSASPRHIPLTVDAKDMGDLAGLAVGDYVDLTLVFAKAEPPKPKPKAVPDAETPAPEHAAP